MAAVDPKALKMIESVISLAVLAERERCAKEIDAAKRRLDEIAHECDAMARDDTRSGAEKRSWERAAKIARAPLDN